MKIRWVMLGLAAVALGCTERGGSGPTRTAQAETCIDRDGDGYGRGCPSGADCNDNDPAENLSCMRCAYPDTGCPCDEGTAPVGCFVDKTQDSDGNVMCNEGTRYCRDGSWSSCEDIHSYPLPDKAELSALVDEDAGPVQCSDCNVKCFVIRDNLDPVDGGLIGTSNGSNWASGGGLTISFTDAGFATADGGTVDGGHVSGPGDCVPGTAPDIDCDGIVDDFDPYPFERPFATSNPAIFLDLAPGETGTGVIDLVFFMNTIDVYFLLDQTDSMQSVRTRLRSALLNGTFLADDVECADTDFDNVPNNELKAQGVLGGIRCLLRNAWFGTGFFREIPFTTYGNDDEITFQHALDITEDVDAALDALGAMSTDRDVDWPDADPLALYSLATGNGLYMGIDKPGVPPRTGCPAGHWGYACFRPDAIPVAFLFTDSPMHEGPEVAGVDFTYDESLLTITSGSVPTYFSVSPTNESFETSYDLGEVSQGYLSYTGDTSSQLSNYTNSQMSCVQSGKDAAPDAVFTFELDQASTVKVSTSGTAFTPAVGIYNHVVSSPLEAVSANQNETSAEAMNLGDVADSWVRVSGDTNAMVSNYTGTFIGCSADDAAPDAVYKFSVSHDTKVALGANGYDTVISLHDSPPALTTKISSGNTNDTVATPFDVGDVFQRIYAVGGDTSAAALSAVYAEADIGCSADTAAVDAVHRFYVTSPTRVRIDTAGSSFDTVIGLADGALGAKLPVAVDSGDYDQFSAFDAGDVSGAWYGLSGTTAGHVADYRATFIGCSAETFSPDAIVKFSLSQATRVRFDTTGSAFDTVISVHDGIIDPTTPLTSDNTNETADSPNVLGVIDDSWFEVFGGDTTLMSPSYTQDVIGCGADTNAADAVFAFEVVTDTNVEIDTLGSTFDTVISLHDQPPPRHLTNSVPDGTELYDIGAIDNTSRIYTGTTTGLGVNYGGEAMGCATEETPPDVAFHFSVTDPTQVEINTEGSDFDTMLALFPSSIAAPIRPTASAIANTSETFASAIDLGTVDGKWVVVSGDTSSMNADLPDFGCSAAASSRDAMIKFTVGTAGTYVISTKNSSFDTVLGVYNADQSFRICDDDSAGLSTSKLTLALDPGVYYAAVKGDKAADKGAYQLSVMDKSIANPIMCNDDALASGRSRLLASLLPGDYHVVLKGARSGHQGAYKIRFTDRDFWLDTGRLACDDNSAGGYASRISQNLTPGTYYVVVKGDLAVDEGPFRLTVRSSSSTVATTHTLACDNDGAGGTASRLELDLDAGEYWAVVKGTSDTASGAYELEMRDIGLAGQGLVLACDDDSGGSGSSLIERDLSPGYYYVFVKGDAAGDKGAYTLNLRDVTNTGKAPLACDNDSGGAPSSYLERTLTAGTYWAVVKGDATADKGAYQLSIRDTGTVTRTSYACSTSQEFTTALAAGRYDLVLKGTNTDQSGPYTLTIGDGTTQATLFEPPDWETTLNALQDRELRVITVLNCHDNGLHGEGRDCDQAASQAIDLANATDALGPTLQPLVVDIDSNGTGIETAIMTQLELLSGHLAMDVTVRLAFEPDANPGFIVKVEAIDKPGDGCDGLIGLEHQNCRPGATPTFIISVTNPLDAPVPLNPADPNGGYLFRADLIADRKYFIDAVPIYVIPQDVDGSVPPPEPQYAASGTYWQDMTAPGCTGNERPDWQDLLWTADIPGGTSVKFSVCAAESAAGLDTCTPTEVATVRGTTACASDADCATGFCDALGVCQDITSGSCVNNTQCPVGSYCDTAAMTCRYASQPVYAGSVLGSTNYFTYLRMMIDMTANTATNDAPTVHDWALTYLCRNVN